MKKLIPTLFVVASLASFASPSKLEHSEEPALRQLEIYEALEKIETDPQRKEVLQKQIETIHAEAKARIETEQAEARRKEEERNKEWYAFEKENPLAVKTSLFSALGTVAGAIVGAIVAPSYPVVGHPMGTGAVGGLVVTVGYTVAELFARGSLKTAERVVEAGVVGIVLGAMPVLLFTVYP